MTLKPDGKMVRRFVQYPFNTGKEYWFWEGGPLGYVCPHDFGWVNYWWVKPGDIVSVAGYRVRIVEYSHACNAYLVVRTSRLAALHYWRLRLRNVLHQVYARLILTAYVWGLADRLEATAVSWKWLKIARRWRGQS